MAAYLAALDPQPALRTGLIAAHAVGGVIAFILGAALAVRRGHHPAQACSYATGLILMAVFVASAVILDCPAFTRAIRGIFTPLVALAAYTVWRGWQARGKLTAADPALPGALDDLSFTLITLFTAFVVILANDLGGPVWLVVGLGVLTTAAARAGSRTGRDRLQRGDNALTLATDPPCGNSPPSRSRKPAALTVLRSTTWAARRPVHHRHAPAPQAHRLLLPHGTAVSGSNQPRTPARSSTADSPALGTSHGGCPTARVTPGTTSLPVLQFH